MTTYKYERVIQIFLLSYFEYCQIWLNVHMGDRYFRNIIPPPAPKSLSPHPTCLLNATHPKLACQNIWS
jgi:hypothetical protein